MKTTITILRGGQWYEWARFVDPAPLEAVTRAAERKRNELALERDRVITRNGQAKEARTHAQKVALAREEKPPADLDASELEAVPDEPTATVVMQWDPAEYCRTVEPSSPAHLIGVTALAMVQNGWAERAVIDLEAES